MNFSIFILLALALPILATGTVTANPSILATETLIANPSILATETLTTNPSISASPTPTRIDYACHLQPGIPDLICRFIMWWPPLETVSQTPVVTMVPIPVASEKSSESTSDDLFAETVSAEHNEKNDRGKLWAFDDPELKTNPGFPHLAEQHHEKSKRDTGNGPESCTLNCAIAGLEYTNGKGKRNPLCINDETSFCDNQGVKCKLVVDEVTGMKSCNLSGIGVKQLVDPKAGVIFENCCVEENCRCLQVQEIEIVDSRND